MTCAFGKSVLRYGKTHSLCFHPLPRSVLHRRTGLLRFRVPQNSSAPRPSVANPSVSTLRASAAAHFFALLSRRFSFQIVAIPLRCQTPPYHAVAYLIRTIPFLCAAHRSNPVLHHCDTVPIRALLFHCFAEHRVAGQHHRYARLRYTLPLHHRSKLRSSLTVLRAANQCCTIAIQRSAQRYPCLMLTSSQRNRPLPLLRHWPMPENRP